MKRTFLVLLPFTIIYAIVSSIGAPGNHYGPPANLSGANQHIQNTDVK